MLEASHSKSKKNFEICYFQDSRHVKFFWSPDIFIGCVIERKTNIHKTRIKRATDSIYFHTSCHNHKYNIVTKFWLKLATFYIDVTAAFSLFFHPHLFLDLFLPSLHHPRWWIDALCIHRIFDRVTISLAPSNLLPIIG